jgi:hypothetical protein
VSFIRTKTVKGRVYQYEVESYRDPETGKVRQRTIKYLGRLGTTPPAEAPEPAPASTALLPGDRVQLWLTLRGDRYQVPAVVVPGSTNVSACQWPKKSRNIVYETVTAPYQPLGTVTVAWEFQGESGTVQIRRTEVKKVEEELVEFGGFKLGDRVTPKHNPGSL